MCVHVRDARRQFLVGCSAIEKFVFSLLRFTFVVVGVTIRFPFTAWICDICEKNSINSRMLKENSMNERKKTGFVWEGFIYERAVFFSPVPF